MALNGGSYPNADAWAINGLMMLAAVACGASLLSRRTEAKPKTVVAPAE